MNVVSGSKRSRWSDVHLTIAYRPDYGSHLCSWLILFGINIPVVPDLAELLPDKGKFPADIGSFDIDVLNPIGRHLSGILRQDNKICQFA